MHKTTRQLITEIVMRAVATTLPSLDAKGIDILTDEYTNIIEAIVVGVKADGRILATSYRTFTIQCAILDEIEKEIPLIEGKLEVTAQVTRSQRKDFLNGTTTVDGCRKGDSSELAK